MSPDSSFSLVNRAETSARAEILYVVSPLVIPIELLHIECVLLYPASQKSVSTKWRVYKGKICTPDIRHEARILYLLILW